MPPTAASPSIHLSESFASASSKLKAANRQNQQQRAATALFWNCGAGSNSDGPSVPSGCNGIRMPQPRVNASNGNGATNNPATRVKSLVHGFMSPFLACVAPPMPPSCAGNPSMVSRTGSHLSGTSSTVNAPLHHHLPQQPPSSPGAVPLPVHYHFASSTDKPTAKDVLCGRGGSSNRHPGNVHFRELIAANQPHYHERTKKQKMMLSRAIYDLIMESGGRFLARDYNGESGQGGSWKDIGLPRSLEKTAQALREKAVTADDDCILDDGTNSDAKNAAESQTPGLSPKGASRTSPTASGDKTPRTKNSALSNRGSGAEPPPLQVPPHLREIFRPLPNIEQHLRPPPPPNVLMPAPSSLTNVPHHQRSRYHPAIRRVASTDGYHHHVPIRRVASTDSNGHHRHPHPDIRRVASTDSNGHHHNHILSLSQTKSTPQIPFRPTASFSSQVTSRMSNHHHQVPTTAMDVAASSSPLHNGHFHRYHSSPRRLRAPLTSATSKLTTAPVTPTQPPQDENDQLRPFPFQHSPSSRLSAIFRESSPRTPRRDGNVLASSVSYDDGMLCSNTSSTRYHWRSPHNRMIQEERQMHSLLDDNDPTPGSPEWKRQRTKSRSQDDDDEDDDDDDDQVFLNQDDTGRLLQLESQLSLEDRVIGRPQQSRLAPPVKEESDGATALVSPTQVMQHKSRLHDVDGLAALSAAAFCLDD